MALYVTAVDENSPAEKFGITVGCALLAIDGHPLNDALDYQFYTTPKSFSLELCKDEQHRTVQVEKGEYEPLGCNFKTYLGDEKHSCANHCMFCFIDQLPPGMREPLYFKDDDERLSFLFRQLYHADEPDRARDRPYHPNAHQPDFCLSPHDKPRTAGADAGEQARGRGAEIPAQAGGGRNRAELSACALPRR